MMALAVAPRAHRRVPTLRPRVCVCVRVPVPVLVLELLTEGIWQRGPRPHAARHLALREQAAIERGGGGRMIELLPDAHKLRLSWAVLATAVGVAAAAAHHARLGLGCLVTLAHLAPWRPRGHGELRAGEGGDHLLVVPDCMRGRACWAIVSAHAETGMRETLHITARARRRDNVGMHTGARRRGNVGCTRGLHATARTV